MRARRIVAALFVICTLILPGFSPTVQAISDSGQQMDVQSLMPDISRVNATATLGTNTVGGQTDTSNSNWINGARFTTPAVGGTLNSISVHVGTVSPSPNNQYQVGIYSDSGGNPASLIAKSASGTLAANAWNTLAVTATLAPNTAYWLMYNTNGASATANSLHYDYPGGTSAYSWESVAFGTWPTSFPAAVTGSAKFSIYGTYTTADTAPTATPTKTNTPVAGAPTATPTATNTPVAGAPTATPTKTNTPMPATATPTATATKTNTPVPAATATPTATSTSTPVPPPPPPGGTGTTPILIVTSGGNPFTRYYTEILTAEGFNAYKTADLPSVTASTLAAYDVVILGEQTLTAAQASMFSTWVNGGGNLIAMRPDKQLASLLGLTDAGSTLANAYLQINTSTSPGAGLVSQTIQYHGPADKYTLNGATSVATLYSDASSSTSNPAVTLRSVGSGQAAAFTYDLARSVVLTRQGNPAWAGQNVDGVDGIGSSDMFEGGPRGQPDWNNLSKAQIPIADEQQRLLGNLMQKMNQAKKPIPRFWYFPRNLKAVVIMTGDDHANGGTATRWNDYISESPAGCSVANWECIRGTSYIYTATQMSNAQAVSFQNQGFELGLHVTTDCVPWGSTANLDSDYSQQLAQFKAKYTGIASPKSSRTHCVEWDDWATQAKMKLKYGMRFDTDYYYYPTNWVQNRPGFHNGTGLIMRFADLDGSLIDVYQATTHITDESGMSEPLHINTLLDNALGAPGYYAAIVANIHTDFNPSGDSDAIVAAAKARGVPVIAANQMLTWLDGRNASTFSSVTGNATSVSFTVTGGANGLRAMLPATSDGASLTGITSGGASVSFTTDTIKGVTYAFFPVSAGTYQATYAADTSAPTVTSASPQNGATGVAMGTSVTATFSENLDASTVSTATFELRNPSNATVAGSVSYNAQTKTATFTPSAPLAASTTYTARLIGGSANPRIKDAAGNSLASTYTFTFTTGSQPVFALGYNTIGSQNDTGDMNYMNGSRFVNGASAATISSMSVYVRNVVAAPNNKFQVAIYTDANGSPGTKVAASGTGTLTANSWNTVPITATLNPNTAYWLMYNTNGDNNLAFDTGSAGQAGYSAASTAFGTWPQSFGSAVLWGARFSIYASR